MELEGYLITRTWIHCTKCWGDGKVFGLVGKEAAAAFYDMGWRVGRHHVYCPKCAKKAGVRS